MNLSRLADPATPSPSGAPQPTGAPSTADRGDLTPDRFEALYRQAWPAVVDYLRYRIGPTDAADVAADIFVRAWAAREQYDPGRGTAATWLWGIARNAARDRYRGPIAATGPLSDEIAADTELSDAGAQAVDMAGVAAAVAQLEPIDQDIIALRFGGGLSNRDVGGTVGLSEAAAAVRLHRAIKRLRVMLEGSTPP